MIRMLRERGLRESLVKRCGDLYRETKIRIRARKELGNGFWTERGIRQECPLSPVLFNMLIADLEERLRKRGWEGGM